MTVAGFISITRPANAVVSGIAALIGYLIATGTLIPQAVVLVPIVALITAAGNVINDIFDAEIDKVNRPRRPIPSGQVSRSTALGYAVILFLAGIILSLYTPLLCIAIVIFNSFLLILYAAKLKSTPLIGNLVVSYLSASIFLFGGALAGPAGVPANLPLAAITFFAMLARELLKDAEDVEGDTVGGARTIPMITGIRNTGRAALVCAIIAAAASIIPVFRWGSPYLVGIAIVDMVIISAAARALPCTTPACVRESHATSLLKAGFFASLVVFSLSAYLL
ncbi:MAG: Digeranylgeranylglyceryl phosphate synthase [Methanoregula sp. PtaU1.Bin051]|nr:MAG: Digeranylgeranylglyceryl phosphate synthase [Methanoregula sp. PtaU1.Bin051]